MLFRSVIAHGEVMIGADAEFCFFVGKKRGEAAASGAGGDEAIGVAGVVVDARLGGGAVDVFEPGVGGVEPSPVDDEVAIVTESDGFPADGDEAFDVVRIWDETWNALGKEDDGFSSFGLTEVVGEPVDEQVVAAYDSEFDDILAFAVRLPFQKPAPGEEIFWGRPDRIGFGAYLDALVFEEQKDAARFFVDDA